MIILQVEVGDRLVVDLGECKPPVLRHNHGIGSGSISGQLMEAEVCREVIKRHRCIDESLYVRQALWLAIRGRSANARSGASLTP